MHTFAATDARQGHPKSIMKPTTRSSRKNSCNRGCKLSILVRFGSDAKLFSDTKFSNASGLQIRITGAAFYGLTRLIQIP